MPIIGITISAVEPFADGHVFGDAGAQARQCALAQARHFLAGLLEHVQDADRAARPAGAQCRAALA